MASRVFAVLVLCCVTLPAQETAAPADSRGWVNKGTQEFKAGQYRDATESFQHAVDLEPSNMLARTYLATAWMSQYIPGAESPENLEMARKAQAEFERVLQSNPNSVTALSSMASLMYQQAQSLTDEQKKFDKLDESAAWYEKLIAADPQNKEAFYSLGVIDWVKWYAAWMSTRAELGMRPEQPGPLPDPARQTLKAKYSSVIDHGVGSLEKALQIDPQYSDAMAYLNLLIRERADLADSPEQYRNQIATADDWVQKALAAKGMQVGNQVEAPPPAPPQPVPQRIRVNGNVQAANLIRKVEPVYPPLARQAQIQGRVRFVAIISREGRILSLQLVSGHPLLIESARAAASQYEYRPTLLNGSPVEVLTAIDVDFKLP
ncbi:MAG TPA: energy transducer TonB [Bryobacteraceae bacterium]|nr:energy transducer TonB [Bryobacteraceae bacterium]